MYKLKEIGQQQYEDYVSNVLEGERSFKTPVKKNNLFFMKTPVKNNAENFEKCFIAMKRRGSRV